LGSYTLIVAPVGVKFGTQEWTGPPSCQIFPQSVQRVAQTSKLPSD